MNRMESNPKARVKDLQYFLKQAYKNGTIKCPECFNLIEPDAEKCSCDWKNPLRQFGLI